MTNRRFPAVMTAVFLSCAATSAFADTQTSASTVPGAKAEKKAADTHIGDQEVVCRREDATGTRLGATKVCHTRAEWSAMAADARDQINRIQTTPQTH